MPRAHALLLEKIHANAEREFAQADVQVHRVDKGLTEDQLIETLSDLPPGPVMVGIRSKTHVTSRIFEAVPRLMAVGAFCIGTDQIDLAAARRTGVAVFNAPFSNTRSVAELVLAEVIMLSRQIFPRNKAAHEGRWEKSAVGSHEVRGKVLGIVGYGHIGSQLSVLAESLGMQVIFYDVDKKLPLGNARAASSLDELLEAADFVSLHVPDTELTRQMIGSKQLEKMRPSACVINASRGTVVDIEALRAALQSKRIGGAAIDVFPREPAAENEPFVSELQGFDNVILTPHIGGSTQEAQANIGIEVADALTRYLLAGSTSGCVTLPQLDQPFASKRPLSRIINVHANVPGVLSQVNRVVAESGLNIVGQSLATNDELGLLFIDIPLQADDPRGHELHASISQLKTSLRTRLVSP